NYGIYVSGSGSFVTETHAYDNNVGIYSLDSTLIAGNHEIYNNGLGIEATNGGRIENNTVFENNAGIVGSSSVVVTGNWAFNNTTFGIAGNRTVQIIGNRVFDNRDGIVGTDKVGSAGNRHFRGLIQNNLVYDNEDVGIAVDGSASGNSIRIINNTVYQGVGNAVHLTRSGADTTLINNILWTDLGSIVFLDDDATGALISDHNLFYRGEANLASIISDQGSVHDSLTDWQTAQPEQDVHSFEGDPLFVNINGANDVLGDSLEGALDDNFRLSADSPAIDAAHTWWASPTDIDRHHRADDPGTTNIGSDDYYADTLGNSMFDDTIGVAQNWRSTNSSWLHTFTDFSFDFFGETYDQLRIGTNGLLNLASNFSQASDPDHSEVKLAERTMIAPLWADLSTHTSTDAGNDIFIEETSDHLTIRWHATHIESGELAEFSATLFADGTIRFDYGQLPEEIAATIGISRGNNQHYVLSPHQNAIPAAPTDSVQFSLRPGHVDIGAYEFRGSSLDDTPPAVVTVDPQAVEDQSATNQSFSQIVVHFTEPLDSINANAPEGFRLLKGTDGNFNESIDLLPTYSAGDTFVTLNVPSGLLTDGTYQLTLFGDNAITDLSGVALDGDGDGQAGGDFIRTFTIDTVAPQVGFEALVTPDASPQLTGTVDDAEAQVTVTIDGNQYDAQNLGDGSWSLAADIIAPLEAGEYDVHVAAIDQAGNLGETTVTSGLTIEAVLAAEVVGRHIFYNGSYFDGHDGGASAADDNAIAPDKQALLEGETATFANYTSYTRGINGIMLDIADLPDPAALSLADFNFQIGNDDDVANWSAAPLPVSFSLRPGEGEAGADRVTLIWEDAAITNTWLQVTVMAGETTGLAADNVFYFGNAVGETGDSESDAQVTSADEDGVAQNPHSPFNPATIDSPYDFNRDRLVSAQDRLIARSNQTDAASALQLITPTSAEVVTESQTFEVQDSEDGDESFDVFDQQAADQWLAMNSYSASSTTFSDESSHTPPTWSRPLWMDLQEDGQKRRSSSLTELSSETSDMVDTLSLVKPVALIR
ncbi:MAG: Ig-like domain-containing protein, partial [Phycisphaeraceae bacterium]